MAEESARSVRDISTNDLLLAILTLMVDEREQLGADRLGQTKTEVLLSNAGLTYATIAGLLGKKPDAVRMMITRARTDGAPRTLRAGKTNTSTLKG